MGLLTLSARICEICGDKQNADCDADPLGGFVFGCVVVSVVEDGIGGWLCGRIRTVTVEWSPLWFPPLCFASWELRLRRPGIGRSPISTWFLAETLRKRHFLIDAVAGAVTLKFVRLGTRRRCDS